MQPPTFELFYWEADDYKNNETSVAWNVNGNRDNRHRPNGFDKVLTDLDRKLQNEPMKYLQSSLKYNFSISAVGR